MNVDENGHPVLTDAKGATRASELRPLRGVVTPLITPLRDRDTLDYEGLERLIEHVLAGGVHGLFLLGTTGEAAAVSSTLRREFIQRVLQSVRGRVPILVGVSDTSVVESLRLAQDAAEFGADAIVVTTPFYLPLEQTELTRYIGLLDRESPLPVVLYNMPRVTTQWFTADVVRQAMQLDNVIGIKDSSGDMNYFAELRSLISERPDWSLLAGSELLLADVVKLGGHGCVGGGSNLWPLLLVDIYHSALRQDQDRLDVLQSTLQELGKLYQFGSYAMGAIRGIKCALDIMGICSGRMADPFEPCSATQQKAIERQLLKLGLLVGRQPSLGQPTKRSAQSVSVAPS